jgi:hypothetical protein
VGDGAGDGFFELLAFGGVGPEVEVAVDVLPELAEAGASG